MMSSTECLGITCKSTHSHTIHDEHIYLTLSNTVGRVLNSHLLSLNENDELTLFLTGKEILFGKSTLSPYDDEVGFDQTIVIETEDDKNCLFAELYVNKMLRGTFAIENPPRNKDRFFVELNSSSSSQYSDNDLRVNLELNVLYFDPAMYEKSDEIPKEMMELVRSVRTVQRQQKIQMYEREIHKLRGSLRGGGDRGGNVPLSSSLASDLKTNQAASEAQIDYLNRLVEIYAKLVKMKVSPSGSGVVRTDVRRVILPQITTNT